jgi:hypothetical protein
LIGFDWRWRGSEIAETPATAAATRTTGTASRKLIIWFDQGAAAYRQVRFFYPDLIAYRLRIGVRRRDVSLRLSVYLFQTVALSWFAYLHSTASHYRSSRVSAGLLRIS